MDDISILTDIGALVQNGKTLGAVGALIIVVNILMKLTKVQIVSKYIKPAWRPWIAMGLGTVGGILATLASGGSVVNAIVAGVIAGLGGVGVHEVYTTVAPTEKAKKEAATAVSKALDGPEAVVKTRVEALKVEMGKLSSMASKKERLAALAGILNRSTPTAMPEQPKG